MSTDKSVRNRTIEVSASEAEALIKRCKSLAEIRQLAKTSATGRCPMGEILDSTILGDSFEAMKLIEKESVDLLIVDPPYNMTKNFAGKVFNKKAADTYEKYTESWLEQALELLKPKGSMYVCCDWESSLIIGRLLSMKAVVRNRITWQREKGRGAAANWKNCMEDIWFVTKGESYTFNLEAVKLRRKVLAPYREKGEPKDWRENQEGKFRDTCPSNFWDDITIPFWSMPENTVHPTQKPEKLVAKLILASSNEGDVVFDPFLGSGTVSTVAKKLGRRFLGIEESKEYCVLAEKRLEMAENNRSIQGFFDGVFWERNAKNIDK